MFDKPALRLLRIRNDVTQLVLVWRHLTHSIHGLRVIKQN